MICLTYFLLLRDCESVAYMGAYDESWKFLCFGWFHGVDYLRVLFRNGSGNLFVRAWFDFEYISLRGNEV